MTGARVVEAQLLCATCEKRCEWRETGDIPFTLTLMDRKLLKSFKIAADEESTS